MCFDSEGLSPSQMMAVWSPRLSRCRSMQFQATLSTPSSNHLIEILPGANEAFSTLVKGLIQSDALGLFGPEAVGIADRARIHFAVLGLIDQGALGPFRGHVVNLLGHLVSSTLRPANADTASRLQLLPRLCVAGPCGGQGGNHPTLVGPLELARPDKRSAEAITFAFWPWLEINVIARIDAATGI